MKKVFFYIIFLLLLALFAEASLSALLLYRYRLAGDVQDGRSFFSMGVAVEKILARLGRPVSEAGKYEYARECQPEPFFRADDFLGYSVNPGVYAHIYKRRLRGNPGAAWEKFSVKVTINPDGTRWTGREIQSGLPTVYILGDSYAFGSGVNNEQTFSYHLQMAMPEVNVRLFALGGYGTVQPYRQLLALKNQIKENDIVVLAYADFHDIRNAAAPSRLRETWAKHETGNLLRGIGVGEILKAEVGAAGEVQFSMVNENCETNHGYCNQPDPDRESMRTLSAALINAAARLAPGRFCLIYMNGPQKNPIFEKLDKKIEVISVLPQDFDAFVKDDIEQFDPHPGPYWHYAVAGRLLERLQKN